MRKYISGSLFIILSGFLLLLISCTEGSCLEETKSSLKATFYLKINDTLSKSQAPDTLTLRGLNNDSIIYNKSLNIQPALFELNASSSRSVFIITINGVSDTIEFSYSSYPHFISKECGYTFYHHLENDPVYTLHAIESVFVTNKTITNLNVENIRIFY
jgi:hypothetical protein